MTAPRAGLRLGPIAVAAPTIAEDHYEERLAARDRELPTRKTENCR